MTRYAMVIDLNTCVGCNACMAACAMENQTPVWENKWRTYVHDEEIGTGEDIHRRFFPRLCNHCTNPPCVSVCPTGATYQMDNGIVAVDEDLCMGCGACAMACPYDARFAVTYSDVKEGRAFLDRVSGGAVPAWTDATFVLSGGIRARSQPAWRPVLALRACSATWTTQRIPSPRWWQR